MSRRLNIKLDGVGYDVAFDFKFIERVESKFSLTEFLGGIQKGNLKISQVAWVLFCGLASAGEKITYEEVGDLVLKDIGEANLIAVDLVNSSISGGPEKPIKKKKATAESGQE